jgi:hypothetical protein
LVWASPAPMKAIHIGIPFFATTMGLATINWPPPICRIYQNNRCYRLFWLTVIQYGIKKLLWRYCQINDIILSSNVDASLQMLEIPKYDMGSIIKAKCRPAPALYSQS